MMSVVYLKESLKRVDKKTLQFTLVNRVDSGSADVGIKILLDGRDLTTRSTLRRGSGEPRPVTPHMYITSIYGDEFLVTVESDAPIEPGLHRIEVTCEIEDFGTFSAKFEGTV